MKKRIRTSWQRLATVIGAFMVTMPVYGDTFRIVDHVALAFFESIDETQCVSTNLVVFAFDLEERAVDPPGPPSSFNSGAEAFVDFIQFDSCTSTQLIGASCAAPLAEGDLQFDGAQLDSATLNATLGCFDSVSNSSFDVFVNLGWMPIGDLNREPINFRFREPGSFSVFAAISTSRSTEASGSVSDGVTNFTPEPTEDAIIAATKSTQIVIER